VSTPHILKPTYQQYITSIPTRISLLSLLFYINIEHIDRIQYVFDQVTKDIAHKDFFFLAKIIRDSLSG
jgi:hypothetical protein